MAESQERTYDSHSSLDSYTDCPMKHRLRYVDKVKQRPMMAGVGGSAVHSVIEHIERKELWRE